MAKEIKDSFVPSYDSKFYIGPWALSEWIQKKTTYPSTIIQAKFFDVNFSASEFVDLKEYVKDKNLKIYAVESDLRNATEIIDAGTNFLVCSSSDQLHKYRKNGNNSIRQNQTLYFCFSERSTIAHGCIEY